MQLLLGVAKCLIDSPMLLAPEKKSDYEASIVARSSAPTLFVQKREICDFAIVKIGLRQNAIIYLGFVVLPLWNSVHSLKCFFTVYQFISCFMNNLATWSDQYTLRPHRLILLWLVPLLSRSPSACTPPSPAAMVRGTLPPPNPDQNWQPSLLAAAAAHSRCCRGLLQFWLRICTI